MYNGEVALLSLDPANDPFVGRLRLNIRWLDDGSGLTPFPAVRTPSPEVAQSGLSLFTPFSVDESADGRHEYVFTVADDASDTTLFRSPLLTTLPAIGQNHAGAFEVIRVAASSTYAALNTRIATLLGAAPVSEGNTTITSATLAASSSLGQIAVTATGAYVVSVGGAFGSPTVTLLTFPFTYTASMSTMPNIDVFTPDRITSASLSAENISFTTPQGATSGMGPTVAAIGSALARLLRAAVEPSLDQEVDSAIRGEVVRQMGLTGTLSPGVTITLQDWGPTSTGVNISASIGGVMPFLPPRPTGCAFPVIVLAAGAVGLIEIARRLLFH